MEGLSVKNVGLASLKYRKPGTLLQFYLLRYQRGYEIRWEPCSDLSSQQTELVELVIGQDGSLPGSNLPSHSRICQHFVHPTYLFDDF